MADSGTYTPETIARKLAMAQQLLGDRKKPITHWAEGLDELAKGYFGGKMYGDAETAQKEGDTRSREFIASLLSGGAPPTATGPEAAAPEAMQAPSQAAQPMGDLSGMPRGLRNNNPLNIEAGGFTQGQPGFSGSDGRFAKFASVDQGLGAANKLLDVYQNKHGLNTVAGVINRWAPAADGNNVSSYAMNVAKQLGIDPNAPIPPEMRPQLIAAMAQHENGRPLPQGAMPQQMAQAGPPQSGNPMQARIVEALRSKDPFISRAAQGMAGSMLQKQMEQSAQANDPLRQLQIKKAERDLAGDKNPESVREYEYAKKQGFAGTFQDWVASKRAGAGEYSLTPVYGKDQDGNTVLVQPGKSGTAIQTKLPDGVTISSGVEKMDLGTQWGIIDKRTGQIVGYQPKDIRGKEREEVIGKGEGEASVSLDSVKSKMPGLEKVVQDLDALSKDATYTLVGQGLNFFGRQLGMEPREAAVARSKYISTVDNQVLPLLRDTFGAAFTVKEGETLRNTLGDPDKTPTEKQAVLKSFIEQKRRDVEALERRVGKQAPIVDSRSVPQGKTSSGVQWSVD